MITCENGLLTLSSQFFIYITKWTFSITKFSSQKAIFEVFSTEDNFLGNKRIEWRKITFLNTLRIFCQSKNVRLTATVVQHTVHHRNGVALFLLKSRRRSYPEITHYSILVVPPCAKILVTHTDQNFNNHTSFSELLYTFHRCSSSQLRGNFLGTFRWWNNNMMQSMKRHC
jgi:hypothetical protein